MIILYIGIFLIFYSVLAKVSRQYNLVAGFLFAFVIMAFQSNVEGDYMRYMEAFGSTESRTAEDEPLWVLLQMPFFPFGWRIFIIALSTFEICVLYKLTKLYAPQRYQYVGVILFFFTFGMMLMQMKALRQGLAIEVSLLPYLISVEKRKSLIQRLIICFGPVIIAFLIHNSAIVTFLPALLWFLMCQKGWFENVFKSRKSEWFWPLVAAGSFFVLFYLKKTIFSDFFVQLSEILTLNEMRLGGYLVKEQEEGIMDVSWLITFYDAVMVFFSMWYLCKANGVLRVLAFMSILSFFCDMLFFGIGALFRIGLYFLITNVAVIPCIINQIHKHFGKLIALVFVVFCVGYAVKTSLPWMTERGDDRFGTYEFCFLNDR